MVCVCVCMCRARACVREDVEVLCEYVAHVCVRIHNGANRARQAKLASR